jgi:HEAT repeat protein
VEPLRNALADCDPAVASTALEALGEIGRRYDLRIEPVGE